MIENWVKATTSDTSTPYALSSVSGFPSPGDAFAAFQPLDFMLEDANGNREAGIGWLDGSGNLVADSVRYTWDGTTYAKSTHDTVPGPVTKTGPIDVTIHPAGTRVMPTVTGTRAGTIGATTRNIPSAHLREVSGTRITLSTGRIWYTPYLLLAPIRCSGVSVDYGTGAGNINIGLYSEHRGVARRKVAEIGQTDTSTDSGTTVYTWSGGSVLDLSPGWYFIAFTGSSSSWEVRSATQGNGMSCMFGGSSFGSSSPAGRYLRGNEVNATTNELPDLGNINNDDVESNIVAQICLRTAV